MKKKVVALVLLAAMTVSSLAGCGAKDEASNSTEQGTQVAEFTTETESAESSEAAAEEIAEDHFAGTTITIAVKRKNGDESKSWNEKEIIKMAEEATGIHVEWIELDQTSANEKIAAMLMGDDQPDAYLGCLDQATLSNNLDLFYDLSEEGLLEKWAPDIVEDYNEDDVWDTIVWPDGAIRGLITGNMVSSADSWGASYLAINQEWLDKLELPVPTTAEELYNTLVAFRDNDMDGDGDPTNEIPLTFCSGNWEGDIMLHANPFGIGGNEIWQAKYAYKNIENGQVVSTVDTDNFRAFLEFYHKLTEEGLLDLEGFSQTSDQYSAKRKEKIAGVFTTYTTMLDQGYTPFIYEGIEGMKPRMTGLVDRFIGQRSNFCVTADSENVEAVLHWWNWLSADTERKLIAYGDPYEIDADGSLWQLPLEEGQPSNVTVGMHNYCPAKTAAEKIYYRPENMAAGTAVRMQFTEEHKDLLNQEGFPTAYADAAAEEERTFMEVELFAYLESFIANSIVYGVTDDSWAKHLEDLKTVQYYDWLDWYQDFVNEVNAR